MLLRKNSNWTKSLDSYATMHKVAKETKDNLDNPIVRESLGDNICDSLQKWLAELRIKKPEQKLALSKRQLGSNAIIAACLNDEEVEIENKTSYSFTSYQMQQIIESFRKWGVEDYEGYADIYTNALKKAHAEHPHKKSFIDTNLLGVTTSRSTRITSDGMPNGISDRIFILRPSVFVKRTNSLESMSSVLVHELVHVAQTHNNCIIKPAKNTIEKNKLITSTELQAYYIEMRYIKAAYSHIEGDKMLTAQLDQTQEINNLRQQECSPEKPFEATGKLVKLLKEVGFDIILEN
jgi:hypothetical protein